MAEEKGEEEIRLRLSAYIGYPPSPPARRPKHRPLLEEFTYLAKEDETTGRRCLDWLQSLSPQERWRVLTVKDAWFASMLREMFSWKVEQGELVFEFTESMTETEFNGLCRYFYRRRRDLASNPQSELKMEYEREMEQRIRIADWTSYLDTITVDYALAEDFPHFLDLMQQISGGKAFTSPCRAHFDAGRGVWYFESPRWLFPGFNSLASWACAWLERGVWVQFWKAKKEDPRARADSPAFPTSAPIVFMEEFENLSEMWLSLTSAQKDAIQTAMEANAQEVYSTEMRSDAFLGLSYSQIHIENASPSAIRLANLNKSSGSYYQKHYSLIESYNKLETIRDLRVKAKREPKRFVEFLLLSSLDRTMTLLDVFCRQFAQRLLAQWRQTVVLQLFEECKQPQSKSAKKSKGKPKKSKAQPAATSDCFAFCMDIVKSTIDGALRQAAKPLEPSAGYWPFVNQTSASNIISKMNELNAATASGKSKKARKKKRTKKTQQSDVVGAGIPAQKRAPFARLHSEIQSFCTDLATKLSKLKPERDSLLGKLTEICIGLFPGCRLEVFGSWPLEIALESSDIDTVVVNSGARSDTSPLQLLGKALQATSWASKVTVIDTASVPIVKLEALPASGQCTKIDITLDDRSLGLAGTHLGLERLAYTQRLLREFPPLRELTLVLKQLLALCGLNSAYKGYLSSYSLLLWIAARLMSTDYSGMNLGQILNDFIGFYSDSFDPMMMGVNITQRQAVTIDPVAASNNTTWNAYNLRDVICLFRRCKEVLNRGEKVSLEDFFRAGS